MSKKILITAGGTGGHVFPGIAVAEVLQSKDIEIVWIGRVDSKEQQWVEAAGIRFCGINAYALRGKGIYAWLALPWRQLSSVMEARRVLKAETPDAVLGMGGYVTAPVGLAAWTRKTPLVIHEQNAIAGMTNKWLAKIATTVLCAVPVKGFQKSLVVGNPVRADIQPVHKVDTEDGEAVSILIIGGSQGAEFLNTQVALLLAEISVDSKIKVVHQAGDGRDQETQTRYQQQGHQCVDLSVVPFIKSMNEAYEQADLIICRSGALTVAEVAKVGLPAVFIPFPHAVDDHQTANAQALAGVGAAVIVQERDFKPESVRSKVVEIIKEPLKRKQMAVAARQVMPANSAEIIAAKCQELMAG